MENLKREDLVPLRNGLEELLEFMHKPQIKEIPYFCRFLECMKYNLEICFLLQYEGWQQMEQLLIRDWNKANDVLLGIPGFTICEENQSRKVELDCQFIELVTRLETYFKNGQV